MLPLPTAQAFFGAHNGSGVLSDETTTAPTYTPALADAGSAVTLTLTVSGNGSCADATDTKVLTITNAPTADAGAATDEVCVNTTYTVADAAVTNSAGILWSHNGSGTLSDETTTAPIYTPALADAGSTVTLTLTVSGNGSCADATDTKVLTITNAPTADAGAATDEVCVNTTYTVADAAVTNSAGILWTHNGSGVLSDETTTTPIYTPALADAGSTVTLTITVSGNGSCADATDTKVLTITNAPTANAGAATDEVCVNTTYTVADAAVTNSAGILWSHNGSGALSDETTTAPTYTPALADAGSTVTLTLTVSGNGSCTDATDTKVLTITNAPTADAGTATDEVCVNTTYTVADAAVTNSAGILWTHNGSGVLSDETTTTPTYTPALADAGSTVTLTLTVSGNGSCTDATDTKVLTITNAPTADAGAATDEVCVNTTYTVADAAVTNSAGILWTHNGSGVLSDETTTAPTYTPALADAGSTVTLTLTVSGNGSCTDATDTKVLTVTSAPTANAGAATDEVCVNTTYTVADAAVTNSAGILWTHNGSGALADETTTAPTYTPALADAGSTVTLTLTVSGNGSCTDATDTKVLTVTSAPTANAGAATDEVCVNTTYTVADAAVTNSAGILWTHNGSGALADETTTAPTYTPAVADAGSTVTLTITVSGNGSCADATDTKVLTITNAPTANAGAATDEVCVNTTYTVADAAVTNSAGILWTHNGSGALADETTTAPTYTPAVADAGSTVTLTITVSGNGSCADATDTKVLTITNAPTANAGAATDEVCVNTTYTVADAAVTNSAGILWTHDGSGALSDETTTAPTYTPALVDAGSTVTLTITVSGNGSCADATDTKLLTITTAPTADAGSNSEACASDTSFDLAAATTNASASNFASLSWSTSGTGSFDNNTSLLPIYTPSPADKASGNVTLTLTASGLGSCASTSSDMLLTIAPLPSVVDQTYTLCEDLAGSATTNVDLTTYNNAVTTESLANVSITWFTNSSLSTAVVDDTSEDATNGSIYYAKITLISSNCFSVAQVDFLVNSQIVIDAGSDEAICAGGQLNLASVTTPPSQSNATTLTWTTSGDGSFDNNSILTPIYTPGPTDLANSPITLTLTGNNAGPCADAIDQLTLTIKPAAVINSIADIEICPTETQGTTVFSANISGGVFSWSVTNASQLGLPTNGTGNLPAFTAQANNTGVSIVASVTVNYALNGCNSISESFDIEVKPTPVIDDISDIELCPGEIVSVNFNANTSGETFNWTNDNPAIGASLAPSGSGDISFTAQANTSGLAITSNFTYSAMLDGCTSIAKTFKVTVLPQPVIDPIGDLAICSFNNIVTNFSSNVTGATFNWVNDNTATGIAASGTGNINTTASENLTGANLISNVTVTAVKDGCVSAIETFTITLKPNPIVAAQSDIEICANDAINEIIFSDNSSGVSTISWTATNAGAIGLATGSGTGSIPAFTANINNTTAPIISNVTVTSLWNGCVSHQLNFKIILKPTPVMNAVADAQLCAGDNFSINFTNSLGGSTSYTWTNSNPAIGLPANGINNVNFTAATNNTGANILATITVTPENGGCSGDAEIFILTLKPSPVIAAINDVSLCSEEFVSIPFTVDLDDPTLSISNTNNSLIQGGISINGNNLEFTTTTNTSGADMSSTISLTATKNGCPNTESFVLTLKYKPVVSSIADRAGVCPGDIIPSEIFTHASGTGVFAWEVTNPALIGDATPTSGAGNLPAFTAAQNLTGTAIEGYVKYFSTRNGCLSVADSFAISIKPAPVVTNIDQIFCDNDNVNITFENNTGTINASGDVTYFWTNSNTSIGINNPSGTTTDKITSGGFPANAGAGTDDNVTSINVYASIGGCVGPAQTFEIRVKPLPIFTTADAEFTQTTCSGDNFTFSPSVNIAATVLNWTLLSNSGGVSGATAAGNGELNLQLVNNSNTLQIVNYEIALTNSACVGETKTLTIRVYPELNLSPLPIEKVVCSGSSFEIALSTTNAVNVAGEDVIYEWQVSTNNAGATSGSGTMLMETLTNNKPIAERDTVFYYIRPTLNSGLCVGDRDTIAVIINPEAIVFAGTDMTVCEGETVLLSATIDKGASSGSWTGGVGVFNNRNALSTFYNPAASERGSTITFTFTSNDPDGSVGPCSAASDEVQVFVDELPTALIVNNPFASGEYCVRDNHLALDGNNTNYASSDVEFRGAGVFYNSSEQRYYFNPELATVGGPYTITYEVTNANGCSNTDEVTVTVTNGLSPGFRVENTAVSGKDYVVCFNQTGVALRQDERLVDGIFSSLSGFGVEFNAEGIPIFNPSASGVTDTTEITFTIEDPATQCTSDSTVRIIRIPKPTFEIESTKLCDPERPYTVIVTDLTSYITPFDQIESISYSKVDNNANNILSINGDTLTFSAPGQKSINVTWNFDLGCINTQQFIVNVGNIDSLNFGIDNIKVTSAGEPGTALNVIIDAVNITIDEYLWSFGDGTPDETTTSNTIDHNFTQSGTYNIRLIAIDQYGCTDTARRTINIVPAISEENLPYLEKFEGNAGGWFTEFINEATGENRFADNSSWTYKNSSSAFDNDKNSSDYWMTAINGIAGYSENERSYLIGPTFDLTSLQNPIISFDMYLDFEDGKGSGAIIEYNLGDNVWRPLGTENDQLNWYNGSTFNAIAENPFPNDGSAWVDEGTEENPQTRWNWVRVAHKLDEQGDKGNITFRFTFNGNFYDGTSPGMAIDNFYIGNNPNSILLENFTSFEGSQVNAYNTQLNELVTLKNTSSANLIPLEFHISYPNGDSLNARYPVGLDSRANNYGINKAPIFVLDGKRINGLSQEAFADSIDYRSLQAPDTLVQITIDETVNQNILRFNSSITLPEIYAERNLNLYHFIVEKELIVSLDGQPTTIFNVVRKTLPEIDGELIAKGTDAFNKQYEWQVSNIYAGNQLAIVTVIQDLGTNEVIQAKITNVLGMKVNSNILALAPEIALKNVEIYPIPTNDKLNIKFKWNISEEVTYFILDNAGKIIQTGRAQAGQQLLELSLAGQSSGMYHLLLKDKQGNLSKRKIVVIE